MRAPRPGTLLWFLAVALFAACLMRNGYYLASDSGGGTPGYLLLAIGWLGVFTGVIAWFANPPLIIALVLIPLGFHRVGALLALIALAIALTFLRVDEILVSEEPAYSKITRIGPGYWLWLASMATGALAGVVGRLMRPRG